MRIVLVTLPIGNPEDITERAKNALSTGKVLIAEDTRRLIALLRFYKIELKDKTIDSFHDFSVDDKVSHLFKKFGKGDDILIVSDAGSPIISDPSYPIIKEALRRGIPIESFPGVTSPIVALELSGLPPYPFHFFGFFPRVTKKQKEVMETLKGIKGTHILFEAPTRVKQTLEVLTSEFPEQSFCVARELTKQYQSIYRFKGNDYSNIESDIVEKGEFVILFCNQSVESISALELKKIASQILEKGAKPKLVAKLVGEILGEDDKEIYKKCFT